MHKKIVPIVPKVSESYSEDRVLSLLAPRSLKLKLKNDHLKKYPRRWKIHFWIQYKDPLKGVLRGGDKVAKLTFAEMETVIRYDMSEDIAHVWTCQKPDKVRLQALAREFPGDVQFEKEQHGGVWYVLPKKLILIRKPARKLTAEQRKANIERLAQHRFKK
jgi:hypothetical protein